LDPALDLSQYAHTAWKIRDGFSKGFIISIALTPDGYLWLGIPTAVLGAGVPAMAWRSVVKEQAVAQPVILSKWARIY
jgi:hypothetical protein